MLFCPCIPKMDRFNILNCLKCIDVCVLKQLLVEKNRNFLLQDKLACINLGESA